MHANIFGCGKIRRRNTADSTAPNTTTTNIHLPKRRKTLSDHQLLFATQRRHKFEIGSGIGGEGEHKKKKKRLVNFLKNFWRGVGGGLFGRKKASLMDTRNLFF